MADHTTETPNNRHSRRWLQLTGPQAIATVLIAVLLAAAVPWMATWRIRSAIRTGCEPSNSAIQAVADVIRRQHVTPIEEVALVEIAANHLLDYDHSRRVYGPGVPSVSEMLVRRRVGHWLYPHGDCKEHAVIAGSLLSALQLSWDPVVSFPLGHAWVRVHLPNGDWDILAAPLGNWEKLGPIGLEAISLASGGSAVPIRSPSIEMTEQTKYRLMTQRLAAIKPSWQDAAVLGVVIVTPAGVYDHAPVDYAALDERFPAPEEALRQAKTSGFPFGEPL